MKKILTLVALFAMCLGANAATKWVEDYKIDYSQNTGFPYYVMGYVPEWFNGVMTDFGANYKYVAVNGAEETSSTTRLNLTNPDGTSISLPTVSARNSMVPIP